MRSQLTQREEAASMECRKSEIHREAHRIPDLQIEDQKLTSFAGLVVFQALFSEPGLKGRLNDCFRHLTAAAIFGHGVIVMLLMVRRLLGYRRLQDMRYYQDDSMVHRLLGMSRLPDVASVSRDLAGMDVKSVGNVRRFSRQQVLDQSESLRPARVALDFDGPVLSTGRLTWPKGNRTLTLIANPSVKSGLSHYFSVLKPAV